MQINIVLHTHFRCQILLLYSRLCWQIELISFFKVFFLSWLVFYNLVVFLVCVIIVGDRFCAVLFNVSFLDAVVVDCFIFPLSGSLRCFGVPLLRECHYWNFRERCSGGTGLVFIYKLVSLYHICRVISVALRVVIFQFLDQAAIVLRIAGDNERA